MSAEGAEIGTALPIVRRSKLFRISGFEIRDQLALAVSDGESGQSHHQTLIAGLLRKKCSSSIRRSDQVTFKR
jgi:hypothetical protein